LARRLARQAEKDNYPVYKEYSDIIVREVEKAESVLNDFVANQTTFVLKVPYSH